MFDSRYRGGTDRRQGHHPSPPWVELRVSSLREQVGVDAPCAYLCPLGCGQPRKNYRYGAGLTGHHLDQAAVVTHLID